PVGAETEFTLQIDNEGDVDQGSGDRKQVTTARNVVVDAEMDDDDAPITITSEEQSVGSVTDDQPTDVPLQIEVPDDAEPGTYDLDVEIDYRWSDQIGQQTQERSTSKDYTVEIEVDDEANFRITDVESDLRVGEEGEVSGEIENIGGEDVTNAEVQFPTESETIEPLESSVAVGDIDAGDSADFSIPIDVGSEAEAVPKQFDLPVEYRDENGIAAEDGDPQFRADVAEERDEFELDVVDRSITAGESIEFEVNVTNNRDETLTDIEPKLFTDSPFDSSDDEGFIDELEPGESETVTFELSAESGATPKTSPVTVDFRYDDEDGDSRISDSYRVAIDVLEAEDEGPLGSFGPILVVLATLLAVGGGYVWYRGQ
ncbi:MAG: COG1361 S-layer family protein, partial [Halohasta sp.]